ncbi:uncharacterized protein LOC141913866 [Tubulanus polymorphus]|uniref:uncharacterized protein LOC141913866 n=1 Tax=Tubulanus polymorphus TaxID=672921 RepID=UPI003DA49662
MLFSIINGHSPNSPDSTDLLGYFEAIDSPENLEIVFGKFRDEFDTISYVSIEFKQHPVRIFFIGDIHYLCSMMGHQGCSASFPCLWCYITLDDLRNKKGLPHSPKNVIYPLRDINTYLHDLNVMNSNGSAGPRSHSINRPMLFRPLDIAHLVPPPLHISLGIGLQIFQLVEQRCQELDKTTLNERDPLLYEQWANISEKVSQLEDQLADLNSKLTSSVKLTKMLSTAMKKGSSPLNCSAAICLIRVIDDPKASQYVYCTKCDAPHHEQCILIHQGSSHAFHCHQCTTGKRISPTMVMKSQTKVQDDLKFDIEAIKIRLLPARSSLKSIHSEIQSNMDPLQKALDNKLHEIGIDRQAYHSNSFIGNHIHKLLKIDDHSNNPSKLLSVLNQFPQEKAKLLTLFTKFSEIYALYTACRFLSQDLSLVSDNVY